MLLLKDYINELDAACGDGDCGESIGRLCTRILAAMDTFDFSQPRRFFLAASLQFEDGGGTLCILLALYLAAAANAFTVGQEPTNTYKKWLKVWQESVRRGLEAVQVVIMTRVRVRVIVKA